LSGENDLTSLLGENETLENVLVLAFEEIEQVNTDSDSYINITINGQEQSINLHNNNNQL
jgi:hypothetical protein